MAYEKNLKKRRIVAGGSTISQQLAKNLFLSTQKTPWRKIEEAIITLMLENVMTKRRILEIYLNIIEWGNNIFGAKAAALHYYNISTSSLSSKQSAHLAAMIPNPRFYDRNRNTPLLLRKSDIIHHRMVICTYTLKFVTHFLLWIICILLKINIRRIYLYSLQFSSFVSSLERFTMTRTTDHNDNETEDPKQHLQRVVYLLSKNKLVEGFVQMQDEHQELDESLVHEQNLSELQDLLDILHPADIAYILEALPLSERLMIWEMVKAERDGEILLETSDAVRETLIATMDSGELVAATGQLDADEIADLAPDLPRYVLDDLFQTLPTEEREQLRAAMSYPDDAVGALMDFDMVTIREDVTLEVVLRYLRRLEGLPDHTDQLFVVDRSEKLIGVLPLNLSTSK